jgi:hypothetical protein
MSDPKDYESELERIQGIAMEHAIQEMDASADRGLATKEDRGDRGFLTGMAAKSLGVAVRIEQFLILRRREGFEGVDDTKDQAAAKLKMLKKARTEVASILERAGVGYKPRA